MEKKFNSNGHEYDEMGLKLDPWGHPIPQQVQDVLTTMTPAQRNLITREDTYLYSEELPTIRQTRENEAQRLEDDLINKAAVEERDLSELEELQITEAKESIKRMSYLSAAKLKEQVKEVNDALAKHDMAIITEWRTWQDKITELSNLRDSVEKVSAGITAGLESRNKILELNRSRADVVTEFIKERTEIAKHEYDRLNAGAKPSDLSPSDYAYIGRILDYGGNAAIGELLKTYKWHPVLLGLINSTRPDLKLVHPLLKLADPTFDRTEINDVSGAYLAALRNFLNAWKSSEYEALPPWAWPLRDSYLHKDPWGHTIKETPAEAAARLSRR